MRKRLLTQLLPVFFDYSFPWRPDKFFIAINSDGNRVMLGKGEKFVCYIHNFLTPAKSDSTICRDCYGMLIKYTNDGSHLVICYNLLFVDRYISSSAKIRKVLESDTRLKKFFT